MNTFIDSQMTIEEALHGTKAPEKIVKTLSLIDVDYFSFDGKLHRGQILVHQKVADELKEIFAKLLEWRFSIGKAVPISFYDWNDEASMADNNSSAFNYRLVYGTNEVSNHSYGLALDINTVRNPYIAIDGQVFPAGAVYDPTKPGTLAEGDKVVGLFESYGWQWGGKGVKVGDAVLKDLQHFQKIDA